jgi:hypothetical protein
MKFEMKFRIDPTIPSSAHTYRPGACESRNSSRSTESNPSTLQGEVEVTSIGTDVELDSLITEVELVSLITEVKFKDTHCTSTSEKKIGPVKPL